MEAHQKRAGVTSTRVASLNLIDLAGSERQQHAGDPRSSLVTPYESLRVKEAGAINKSRRPQKKQLRGEEVAIDISSTIACIGICMYIYMYMNLHLPMQRSKEHGRAEV